jgi:motility quorum-sensing regulator/GCU-specific mRNA interferase toxin
MVAALATMPSYQKPTYSLATVISLVRQGQFKVTKVAREGAAALGLDFDGLVSVVLATPKVGTFYKTMEAVKMPGHWMDVYHTVTPAGDAVYLKFMVLDGVLIVSFKEL